jgi:hypothetical protein
MPRFYFDVDDGETIVMDDVGLDLDGFQQAQGEAVKALPTIAKDCLPDGTRREFVVTVRNEVHRQVLRAKLSLTVETLLDA